MFFFRIFRTLPGHVLQLAYLFQIFRTFSSSSIFAHAPEGPHFFRAFARAPGMFFFRIFRTLPKEMYYIWHIYFGHFRHLASKFICAHLANAMEVLHLSSPIIQAPGPHTVLNSQLWESRKLKPNIWEFPNFSPEHTIRKICRANIGPHNQP